MTCLFFDLLPADLHIDILYAWLNIVDCGCSLFKVLSALDVACSMSEQPSLRFLMAQLPPFGESTANYDPINRGTRHTACYLQWLANRHVPVKWLLLVGNGGRGLEVLEPFSLPLIETLHWREGNVSAEAMAAVLRCLTNLTAIHQPSAGALDSSLVPNLKVFILRNIPRFIGSCPQLQELRIGKVLLMDELADHLVESCPNLTLLEMSMNGMNFDNLRRALRACSSISELIAHDLHSALLPEVVAFANLRRLTISGGQLYYPTTKELTTMFVLCSHLEYFKSEVFVFSCKDSRLELPGVTSTLWSAAQLSMILSHYTSLEVLSWRSMEKPAMVNLLADKCCGALRSLTIGGDQLMISALLQRCGMSLRSLDLDYGFTAWRPLALVAATCSRLETLKLRHYDNWEEETALFAACGHLKELTLRVYHVNVDLKPVLRAILADRLVLTLLRLCGANDQSDAIWFSQQAQKQQLLPVPDIVIGHFVTLYD